jgi:hypothetical protein
MTNIDYASRMGARDNEQWTVAGMTIVQMHADSNHTLKHVCRRLYVRDLGLNRPWAETWNILSFGNCNRDILVPQHVPIGSRRLVEKNRSDQCRLGIQRLARQRDDGWQGSEASKIAVELYWQANARSAAASLDDFVRCYSC